MKHIINVIAIFIINIANATIIGGAEHKKAQEFLNENPQIKRNLINSYNKDSYAKCSTVLGTMMISELKGEFEATTETKFMASIDWEILGLVNKKLKSENVSQEILDQSTKKYFEQIKRGGDKQLSKYIEDCGEITMRGLMQK